MTKINVFDSAVSRGRTSKLAFSFTSQALNDVIQVVVGRNIFYP